MEILVATEKPFAPAAVEQIRAIAADKGLTLRLLERYTPEQLREALPEADALIVRSDKVTAEVIAAAPRLRVIVRAGAGYDNIDLEAASARGISVQNTPGQNSNAVAELALGMAVMAMRNMYDGTTGRELRGSTLGIHAFGAVGRCVARIAAGGFGMEVSALDPFCPDSAMEEAGVRPVHTPEELYSQCRVVSLHVPATPATRGSIGYDLLKLMPKGALLINTARKEVIDEPGLIKALEERPDLKYVADVRPDCADELLRRFEGRVWFTPKKMGAQTAEANLNAGLAAARQAAAFLTEGVDLHRVNK